jgi:1-acyl-sn-glycerol-3-phosphate acyltransferase
VTASPTTTASPTELETALPLRLAQLAWWMTRSNGPLLPEPSIAARRHQEAAREMCRAHAIDVTYSGALPPARAVVVANHLGYLDAIAVGALIECVGIAKAEVATWPLIGPRLESLGVAFVDRANPWSGARALRAALRALDAGTRVLNFPEGTTSPGHSVLPFKRGIFGAAQLADAPIVPAHLSFDDPRVAWTGDATFLPHYLALVARGPVRARVRFGAPIHPRRGTSPSELAGEARAAIASMAAS